MKELVFKQILGYNPRKREISLEETTGETRAKVTKKWVCKYFIRERYYSQDVKDLERWVSMKRAEGCQKDCHVLRELNTRTGENKVICKVRGDIFVVDGETAYRVVYVNELRIQLRDAGRA